MKIGTSVGEFVRRFAILLDQHRQWIFLATAALVAASILFDIGAGRVRLRGIGTYLRADQPGPYWRWIALKFFLGLVCGYLAWLFSR